MSLVCEDKNSCLSQKIHADSQWKTNNQQNGGWVQTYATTEENPLFDLTFYLESSKHAPRTDRIFARRATILIAISLNPPKVAPNFTKALHDRLDYRVDFVQFRHCWTSHLSIKGIRKFHFRGLKHIVVTFGTKWRKEKCPQYRRQTLFRGLYKTGFYIP